MTTSRRWAYKNSDFPDILGKVAMKAVVIAKVFRGSLIEFEDFVSYSESIFKTFTFTLDQVSKAKTAKDKVEIMLKDFFFWFTVINVLLMIFFVAANAIVKSLEFSAMTSTIAIVTSGCNVGVKSCTVYFNKSSIVKVLGYTKRDFPIKQNHKRYKVNGYLSNYKKFAKLYTVLFAAPCLSAMVIPLIKLFSSGEKTFPLNVWMPFDTESTGIYALAYIWTVWTCTYSVVVLIAIDSLMFVLITLVTMEFDILKLDFLALNRVGKAEAERQVGGLVERHSNLIECSKSLERVYSPSFLYTFMQGSFVICLTAFQYMASSEATALMFNGTYCAAILNQILLVCYFGQKIIDSSGNIADNVYNCGWERKQSDSLTKAAMLVVQRGQTPVKLTAMNFMDVSLPSFRSVREKI